MDEKVNNLEASFAPGGDNPLEALQASRDDALQEAMRKHNEDRLAMLKGDLMRQVEERPERAEVHAEINAMKTELQVKE